MEKRGQSPFFYARRVKNADRKIKGILEIKRLHWSIEKAYEYADNIDCINSSGSFYE